MSLIYLYLFYRAVLLMDKRTALYKIRGEIFGASHKRLPMPKVNQLAEYIWLFRHLKFKKHWQVNEYIDENDLWDDFDELRSKNTHANGSVVDGIAPPYFAIVAEIMCAADTGSHLVDYERW